MTLAADVALAVGHVDINRPQGIAQTIRPALRDGQTSMPTIRDLQVSLPKTSPWGRVARAPLKLIPSNVPVRIVTGPLKGSKWITGAGTNGCWLGTYELATQRRMLKEARPNDIAFDLGANHGFFAMLLARSTKSVIAVEPFAPNVAILKRHLQINQLTNCVVVQAAVGLETGTAFFAQGINHAMGRICGEGEIEVNLVSLEELVNRFGVASIIKIDVEGAELEVLEGGRNYLKEVHPKLFLSTHGNQVHTQSSKLLRSLGFDVQEVSRCEMFAR